MNIALRGLPPPPPSIRDRLGQGADYHAGSVMLAALVREAQSPTIGKAA